MVWKIRNEKLNVHVIQSLK